MSTIDTQRHTLSNGDDLVIRTGIPADAADVLEYVETVSGESDFLSFGPGEFGFTEDQEKQFLRDCHDAENRLFVVGCIDGDVVALLTFSGGPRPQNRHTGEFGMSVRKSHWGLGVGSVMLDSLIDWARSHGIVKKINLRVRTDNARAIALYERKGFAREGTITKEVQQHGRYFDHHWMGLGID
jgi:RimJ/RimL family protein N-acetyltransferase